MKLKLSHVVLLVSALALLLLAARPLQDAPPVDPAALMPTVLVLAITALVNWGVTEGNKSLTKAIPWLPNLSGVGTSISAAVTNLALLVVSGAMSHLPPELQNPVGQIAAYLISLFLAYGLSGVIQRFAPPKPKTAQ